MGQVWGAPVTDPLSSLPAAIHAVAPHADAATWAAALAPPMRSSGITTPSRIAAFVGQIAVESGYFTALVEDLNYSAERLCKVWPDQFPTLDSAWSCFRKPERTANVVYANRMGNGDEASGDGWTFRGRGLIQITGRSNYTSFAAAVHMPLDAAVEFAGGPNGAAASACWFWSARGLNAWADTWEITAITRRINPALMGAAERIALAHLAREVLTDPVQTAANYSKSIPPSNIEIPITEQPQPVTDDDLNAAELVTLNPTPEQPT